MALPQYGGPDDVVALIRYLKTKPAGATLAETRRTLDKAIVDARKLAAIETWGFIQRTGDRLSLTEWGREIARDANKLPSTVVRSIKASRPYREVLEMAHHKSLPRLDTDEVGAFWHEHFPKDLGTESEKSISAAAATFFKLSEAGGIGRYVLGRKGSPTRLDLDPSELRKFVEAGPDDPPWSGGLSEGEMGLEADDSELGADSESSSDHGPAEEERPREAELRVFISHGKNQALVDQVETVLGLAGIESEIAVKEESTAIPVPEKVLSSMRRCGAGIMIVSVDEADETTGPYSVNDNVLIEIGAAFVLYDRRVVLVWDKRIPVPSNLQGLYRCEFEGDELGWGAGVRLTSIVQ